MRPGKYLDQIYYDGRAFFDQSAFPAQVVEIEIGGIGENPSIDAAHCSEIFMQELLKFPQLFSTEYSRGLNAHLTITGISPGTAKGRGGLAPKSASPTVEIGGVFRKFEKTVFVFVVKKTRHLEQSDKGADLEIEAAVDEMIQEISDLVVKEILNIISNL